MQITNEIKYVGVNDHKIDLFEGQFIVPNGMSYNSYVILDDKIAVMDSVDQNFGDEWISNIKNIIGNKSPDFLVVHHMEMDHSANIAKFMEIFPNAKIVSSKLAFVMMKNYFGTDFENRQIVVAEGSTLELGKHTLNFVAAPNVHWPEVIMSYESSEKVLFSADGFGKFGALDVEEEWACEARRYYFGIVGKFGDAVQAVIKKLAGIEVKVICPIPGPVLTENLDYYINLYDTWSSYGVESEGVFIAYTSVYGNTKKAVEKFAEILKAKGCPKVAVADLAREDMAECVEDAFKYGKIVLATTTYTNDIFPFMKDFIHHLTGRNYQNRTIGLIENGTWNPLAAKVMTKMFENSKNITFCPTVVTIKTAMNDETVNGLEKLAEEIL